VQDLTSQSAYIGYEVGSTLEETKSLSRSIRSLSDYLERHPESLIRGNPPKKETPVDFPRPRRTTLAFLAVCIALLAGCATTTPSRFYTLTP